MVGFEGTGYFNIENGGTAKSLWGFMGREAGGVGHTRVVGTNSKWIVERGLYVGRLGEGTLTVENGGSVDSGQLLGTLANFQGNGTISTGGIVLDADLHFGPSAGQTFSVPFGTGGTINVDLGREVIGLSNVLGVGFKTTGSLLMDQGTVIKSDTGRLGFWPGSRGIATITGNGTRWETGSLSISENGSLLQILDGGAVTAGGVTVSGTNPALKSQLIVSGSNSTLTANSVALTSELLTVENGGVINTKSLFGSLPQIQGNGLILATGMVFDGIDLRFDSTHGLAQTFAFGNGGQIQLNVDGTGHLGAGYRGQASLTIMDGRIVNSVLGSIGQNETSQATAIVSGQGTQWNVTNNLNVGDSGSGTMQVTAGAKIMASLISVGRQAGAYGELHISGSDLLGNASTVTSAQSLVMYEGKILIDNGGKAASNSGTIGLTAGNSRISENTEVVITGGQSTWNINGNISGNSINTTFKIDAGGKLQNLGTTLGGRTGSNGSVLISGQDFAGNPSVWLTQGNFVLGGANVNATQNLGNFTVTITDHGVLQVTGTLKLFANNTVNLQTGGVLETNHFNVSQQNGIFNFAGGTLDVSGTFTGNLNVPLAGLLTGTSTITGNLVNAGELAPGQSPGKMMVSGTFSQMATGTLSVELGGTVASVSYDQLALQTANLDGNLDLSLINGFQLNAGQVFTILTATQVNGQFSGLPDGGIAGTFGSYNLLIDYQPTQVQLYTQAIPEPGVLFCAGIVCLAAITLRRAKSIRV